MFKRGDKVTPKSKNYILGLNGGVNVLTVKEFIPLYTNPRMPNLKPYPAVFMMELMPDDPAPEIAWNANDFDLVSRFSNKPEWL